MKSTAFWIGRFCTVVAIVFAILLVAGLLRGRPVATVLADSLLWALVSATIFTVSRYYQARKGIACALCRDTVED